MQRRYIMKTIIFFSILFCAIALPSFAELTPQDLDKIRLIVKEEIEKEIEPLKAEIASVKAEIASVKDEIASVKQDVASLSGRVAGIEKQITWLMSLIVVAVGLPQILVVWRSRKDREQERKIEELAREIEMLKQQRIVSP
jgi:septal ring factor EnvC (AmiA/AmiB activator)